MRAPILLLLVITFPVLAVDGPTPFEARYEVRANGLEVGAMERKLSRRGDGTYTFETTLYTTGLMALFKPERYIESSRWQVDEEGELIPLSYVARYSGRDGVVERDTFDWQRGVVESFRKGRSREVALQPGVMDKQLYQFALRADLARGIDAISYPVADRGKIRDYHFEVLGEETLSTPLGELRTLKIAKGTTTLWCAVDLDYTLVKIAKDEDGTLLTSYITELHR